MTRFAHALTAAGAFKAGWYIAEDWYSGKDGKVAGAFRFAYSIGYANTHPKAVNTCPVMIKQFITPPAEAVFI